MSTAESEPTITESSMLKYIKSFVHSLDIPNKPKGMSDAEYQGIWEQIWEQSEANFRETQLEAVRLFKKRPHVCPTCRCNNPELRRAVTETGR